MLEHLAELVVKEVHGSGGYGMLVGPTSSKAEIEVFSAKIKARPTNYIAQPTLALSAVPTFTKSGVAPAMSICGPLFCRATRYASRRAASRAWRSRKARWWSIPARAAAPRTPGFWRTRMLGRTASSLYWMSRYVERAENMARLLEVGYRISLMPGAIEGHRDEWRSTLHQCGLRTQLHGKAWGHRRGEGHPFPAVR